jgi:hypothetical protein
MGSITRELGSHRHVSAINQRGARVVAILMPEYARACVSHTARVCLTFFQ